MSHHHDQVPPIISNTMTDEEEDDDDDDEDDDDEGDVDHDVGADDSVDVVDADTAKEASSTTRRPNTIKRSKNCRGDDDDDDARQALWVEADGTTESSQQQPHQLGIHPEEEEEEELAASRSRTPRESDADAVAAAAAVAAAVAATADAAADAAVAASVSADGDRDRREMMLPDPTLPAATPVPQSKSPRPPPPPPPPLPVAASSPARSPTRAAAAAASSSSSSPKVAVTASSSSPRPSTLLTVHSGRSLHSDEDHKSSLQRSNLLAAAVQAAAAASVDASSSSGNAPAPSSRHASSSSSSGGGSSSSGTASDMKKPAAVHRNFLQRTQLVRARYNSNSNPNRNNNSNSNNVRSDGNNNSDYNSGVDPGTFTSAAVGGTASSTNFPPGAYASSSSSSTSPARHPPLPPTTQRQLHHTTSSSKAALLASRLAQRRGQVFKYSSGGGGGGDYENEFTNSAAGSSSGGQRGNITDSMIQRPPSLMGSAGGGVTPAASAAAASMSAPAATSPPATGLYRKHKIGDQVLVCNHQSRWANLVNRHGFPPHEGATPEERRGPYVYVLAQVKSVHFEEYSVYYTVVRADTGAEQRADSDFMEPLTSPRGQLAALRAAQTQPMEHENAMNPEDYVPQQDDSQSKCMSVLEEICFVLLCPFLWTWDLLRFVFVSYLSPLGQVTLQFLTGQSRLLLNGMEPYSCRLRITTVNLCVICATWYMFIDQARLAFFPPSADNAMAVINLSVWLILIVELFCEVFIRADNYGELIVSEKAYSPSTVRYINAFHLIVESISLALFIPEFFCLFSSRYDCDDRIPFSFYNAALMAVTGPTQVQAFYGKAFFALIRLRVFGLVRHWKTMWIVNTFIHMKWKANKSGLIANIIPSRASMTSRKSSVNGSNQNNGSTGGGTNNASSTYGGGNSPNDDEAALTSASTIGTALMVTNSYRAMAILWIITGLFPLISCLMPSNTNTVAPQLTRQLQATNLISNDTSSATCDFLTDSVASWVRAIHAPDFDEDPSDPHLLRLQIQPQRCFGDGEDILDRMCNPVLDAAQTGTLRNVSASHEGRVHSIAWELCQTYRRTKGSSITELAHELGCRPGSILQFYQQDEAMLFFPTNSTDTIGLQVWTNFSVLTTFDQTYTIQAA
jgi:hypothetical protein